MTPQVSVFRGSDATSLDDAEVMEYECSPEVLAGASELMAAGGGDGYSTRVLYRSPESNGMSLVYGWFKQNFPLPAHSHNADCLYYVISGELSLGKGVASEVIRAGDGFFVPAGVVYGYTAGPEGVEILEFRGVSRFNINIRNGAASMWKAMAATIASNRAQWKVAVPPRRANSSDGSKEG